MDLQLNGMKALITGGSRGIGRAIAEALADEGCNVAICARGEDGVNAAVEALSAKGVTAFGQAVDVGDGDALKAWVAASAEALGGIDNIVSNVTGGNGRTEEHWRANFEYDMLGTVRMVEAAMPHLEKSGNGSILVISTTAAIETFIGPHSYNAIKAALLNYSGALAQEAGAKGIRVNAISPGPIMIEGGAWGNIKKHRTPFYESTLAGIPVGRMGRAEEVAAQAALLASPLAGYTNGTNIVIDGGFTKRIQF